MNIQLKSPEIVNKKSDEIKEIIFYKKSNNSGKFKCNLCSKKLSSELFLRNHMKTIHSIKTFICDYDGREFNTKDKLRLHIYLHRRYYNLECSVCKKSYKTDQAMRKHLRTHIEQYPCDLCGHVFRYKKLLQNHKASVHEKTETVPCNYCTRLFSNTSTRDSHQAKIHKNLKFDTQHFKCDVCPLGFEMREELRIHSFIHFNGEIHTCCECHQIFKKKKMLQIHMKMHDETHLTCEKCNQVFKFKCNLKRHLKEDRCKSTTKLDQDAKLPYETEMKLAKFQLLAMTANSKINNVSDADTFNYNPIVKRKSTMKAIKVENVQRSKSLTKEGTRRKARKRRKTKIIPLKATPYTCDLCGFQALYKSHMLSHIRFHASSKRHNCMDCSETFSSQASLQKHSMKSHGHGVIGTVMYSKESSACPICQQVFSSYRMKHHLLHHKEETFQCNDCPKIFKKKETLQRHSDCHHSIEKRFICSTCGKRFSKKSILTQHETQIHKSVKLYIQCEICLKLMQVKNLQIHMDKMHSDKYSEKPFACSECGKTFRYEKQMMKHAELVHEKAFRGIVYSCTECEMTFNRRSDLREHSFVHFSGKVFQCECGMKFKQRRLLTFHQKVHQREIWSCNLCSSTFQTRGGRRKHLMKAHNQQLHEIIEITSNFNFATGN